MKEFSLHENFAREPDVRQHIGDLNTGRFVIVAYTPKEIGARNLVPVIKLLARKLVPVMKLLSYCLFYGVRPVSFFYRPDNWFKKPNDLMTGTIFHGTG